jgi:hypothetical protein
MLKRTLFMQLCKAKVPLNGGIKEQDHQKHPLAMISAKLSTLNFDIIALCAYLFLLAKITSEK